MNYNQILRIINYKSNKMTEGSTSSCGTYLPYRLYCGKGQRQPLAKMGETDSRRTAAGCRGAQDRWLQCAVNSVVCFPEEPSCYLNPAMFTIIVVVVSGVFVLPHSRI